MKWLKSFFTAPDDFRPLLDLIDERRAAGTLYGASTRTVVAVPQYAPSSYPDGSMDDLTWSLDVIADIAAAPPSPDDAA